MRAARAWLAGLGDPRNVTVVPGNHDSYVRAAAEFAERHWGDYMRGDGGESFPFVRRRGPLALIGLSTSLPTLPLAATGHLHGDQLARLGEVLAKLKREQAFRVVLIHHPPFEGANYFRRLTNAGALRDVLREHGAELVLHGHHHEASLHWLPGPQLRIPVVGVPSASGAPGHHDDPAGYNLYEIEGAWGAWRCTMIARGWRDGEIRRSEPPAAVCVTCRASAAAAKRRSTAPRTTRQQPAIRPNRKARIMRHPRRRRLAVQAVAQSLVQRAVVLGQRLFALDDARRDVMGDRLDHLGDVV